jgi:hypothetical protein
LRPFFLEVELVSIWLSSLPQSLLFDDQRLVSAEKKNSVVVHATAAPMCNTTAMPVVKDCMPTLSTIEDQPPVNINSAGQPARQSTIKGNQHNKYSMQGKYYPDQ